MYLQTEKQADNFLSLTKYRPAIRVNTCFRNKKTRRFLTTLLLLAYDFLQSQCYFILGTEPFTSEKKAVTLSLKHHHSLQTKRWSKRNVYI